METYDVTPIVAQAVQELQSVATPSHITQMTSRVAQVLQRLPVNPDNTYVFSKIFSVLEMEFPRFKDFLSKTSEQFDSFEDLVKFIAYMAIQDAAKRSLPSITDSSMDAISAAFLSKKRKVQDGKLILSGIDVGVIDGAVKASASRTATAQLLLRFLISKVAAQFAGKQRLYTRIEIDGGIAGLAREMGVYRDSDMDRLLTEALTAFQNIHIVKKGFQQHGLLVWGVSGETTNRKLVIDVSSILSPDHVFHSRKGSMLVPIPLKNPEFIGATNTYASQATFQLHMLLLMRIRAPELAQTGGVYFSHSDFTTLANNSDLNENLIVPVLQKWSSGPNAFLKVDEAGKYSLINELKWAQDMMVQAGEASIKGQKRAFKSKNKENA